jgi:LmbE family N-acetylglucosaminyl deacetylase
MSGAGSKDLQPPGRATSPSARSVLVLAPHFDDEVLGCGGLLAQLATRGAATRVLFLSDGAGGVEEVEDRPAYATRRRAEAGAALAVLGVEGSDHLALPDGALAAHHDAIVAGLRRALLSLRPDLVLAPSPLEATSDHRAAFAALFVTLSQLRPGDPLHEALEATRLLLYEVNHPGYPDVLVDVSAQLPVLERAMRCYASQQERHDYLAAAVGLRRYRALSLPPTVAAAEGYRELSLHDFTTRSLSRLVRDLGGVPELLEVREGPRISVVVRTCDRPELLAEALRSLAASSYRRVELVLVNDGGEPPALLDAFPFPVERVELAPRQGRAAAANAGIAAATGDFVAFLDDDDLVEPEHLATLAGLASAADAQVVYTDAAVGVYEVDPASGWRQVERRLPYSRDFDPELLLLDNYIPFHTVLAPRRLLLAAGPLDPELPFFEDWDLLIRLSRLATFHHYPQVTCEYRHFRGGGHVLGERPRERPDFLAVKRRVLERHRALLTPDTLARVVDRLRAEAVAAGEEARTARGIAMEATEAAARESEARYRAEEENHRTRGEAAALGAERARLLGDVEALEKVAAGRAADLERLFAVENELRRHVAEQDSHLARCYTEIERLNTLLGEMRGTRAWRLHQWLERRRA